MSGGSEAEKPAPAGPSKAKLAIGAVVLLVLGGGAGAGGMMAMGGGGEAHAAGDGDHGEGGHGEADRHGAPADDGHGAPAHGAPADAHGAPSGGHGEPAAPKKAPGSKSVVNLGTFTVNLRGAGGGRVLRTEVQVEVPYKDESGLTERKPLLRDAVITLASDYTYADLEGIDGKTHLRDELTARINVLLEGKQKVDRLYFTEFVVQ